MTGQAPVKFLKTMVPAAAVLLIMAWVVTGYIHWLRSSNDLNIREVALQGNELISPDEVNRLTGCDNLKHMGDVSLSEIERRLRSVPFIQSVDVTRTYPGKLAVKIREKKPVALLKIEDDLFCIDTHGLILPSRPGKMYNLPVLSGDYKGGARQGSVVDNPLIGRSLEFLRLVISEKPELYAQISEIVAGPSGRLSVFTVRGGIPVQFGEGRLRYKLHCFDAILAKVDREYEYTDISYIDLRYENQVILGMRM